MACAGKAVAAWTLALLPHARRVLVLVGPGGNGGDGLVAARHLLEAGRTVDAVWCGEPGRRPSRDAQWALEEARSAGVPLRDWWQESPAGPVHGVVDALLGLGSIRSPDGAIAAAIAWANRCGAPTLSVDLPSGMDPDRGVRLGDEAVAARATLCLLTLKAGCFTGEGRDHAGDVWFDDLGVAPIEAAPARLAGPPSPLARRHASHKGSHGDVVVVGGAAGMTGAAALAGRAASAAGAGRVTVVTLAGTAPGLALPDELMSRPVEWLDAPGTLDRATVVAGCGGGDAIAARLPALLLRAPRLVLDADALNALARDGRLASLLRERAAGATATVLTPHPLEAARCLGVQTADVQHDRPTAARRLAARFGCTVVLKGSGTVTASPSGRLWINPTGNPSLAGAGTGDVLAGWLAGAWAQRIAEEPVRIAADAVWLHGRAADLRAPDAGAVLPAGDLIGAIAAAQRALTPPSAG